MNTLEQWLEEQTQQGRQLFLVLDSDGQLEERNALARERGVSQYRNLYIGTPADSLADVAPYVFQLGALEYPALRALLDTPERHWGWLASALDADLDALTEHWQQRLVVGERPNQALYRIHDNRVLGRALAYLQPEQRASYLGPMTSVCYWQTGQWTVTDNPNPGIHALPTDPAWWHTPASEATFKNILFDNVRRYLVGQHTDEMLVLAKHQNIDTWLHGQLELAQAWGWQEPAKLHFLVTQSLHAPGHSLPKTWLPKPDEACAMHFERVYQEVLYWQGDGPV